MLYCVKMRTLKGPGKGSVGYHSVYKHRRVAEYQAKLRNEYNSDFEYFVVAQKPTRSGLTWYNTGSVAFADSVGMMIVDTRTERDLNVSLC